MPSRLLLPIAIGLVLPSSLHAGTLTLESTGQPLRSIVVPEDETCCARFAAEELAHYLRESLKVRLPLVAATAKSIPKPAFAIGSSQITRALGLDVTKLKRESFYLRTTDDYVVIAGDDHPAYKADLMRKGYYHPPFHRFGTRVGTVYGVYTFLREIVGVDWCFAGPLGEVVPKHESLAIPTMDRVVTPSFEQRKIAIGTDHTGTLELPSPEVPDSRFQVRHRWKFRTRQGFSRACQGNHTMWHWGRLFGKDHPEYFALVDGERLNDWGWRGSNRAGTGRDFCWANPATIARQIEEMRTYFTGDVKRHPWIWIYSDADHFPIGANDGTMRICECDHCRRWHEPDGTTTTRNYSHCVASDLYCYHIAEVAKATKKGFPGKSVEALVYGSRLVPPKRVALPDNVKVSIAGSVPALVPHPLYRGKLSKLVRDWRAQCNVSTLWLYTGAIKRRDFSIPIVMPRLVAQEIKAHKDLVEGYFLDHTATGPYSQPELYVATQLLWDVDQDVAALLDRFYRSLYGPAAGDVKACYTYLEKVWADTVSGVVIDGADKMNARGFGKELIRRIQPTLWSRVFTVERLTTALGHLRKARPRLKQYSREWMRLNRCENQLLQTMGKCVASTYDLLIARKEAETAPALGVAVVQAAPVIDGELSDGAWRRPPDGTMAPIAGGKEAQPRTRVWLTRDLASLYLAVECMEPQMSELAAHKAPKPEALSDVIFGKNDDVEIFLDTNNDCDTYYQLAIDAAGQTYSAAPRRSKASRMQLTRAVAKKSDRWIIEIAIPFAQLGGTPKRARRWGINIVRTRRPKSPDGRLQYFGWFASGGYHAPKRFGRIQF